MSRPPIERHGAPSGAASGITWRQAWLRQWHRMRGGVARSTVYLHPDGLLAWSSPSSPAAEFEDFESWCRANGATDAFVVVSGHLSKTLVIEPSLQLDDEAALVSYAHEQFALYHGVEAREWPVAVWTEGVRGIACALSGVHLASLETTAKQHEVRVRSVIPVWSAGLGSLTAISAPDVHTNSCALALLEGTLLTWLVAESGRIVRIEQRFLDGQRSDALADLIESLAEEHALAASSTLVVGWHPAGWPQEFGSHLNSHSALGERACMREWVFDLAGNAK